MSDRDTGHVNDMNGRMQAAYDTVATDYAANNAAMYPELVEYGGYLLAHIGSGGRVLDLGCGPGRDAAWFAVGGAEVVGADLSRGMLTLAQGAASNRFVQLDMRHLAFRSGAFAGVWCMASLLHIPKSDAPEVLREVRRVLAPGGVLALGLQRGDTEGWETHRYGNVTRFFARYTPDEAEAMLAAGGFAVRRRGESEGRGRQWLQFFAVREET